MQYRFYIWDLKLYLDTHPNNMDVINLIEKYESNLVKLEEFYNKNFIEDKNIRNKIINDIYKGDYNVEV